jgi:hypothetical protein
MWLAKNKAAGESSAQITIIKTCEKISGHVFVFIWVNWVDNGFASSNSMLIALGRK